MTTLKELTWSAHKQAESTPIMQHLLSDTIDHKLYAHLVYTKYVIYSELERSLVFQTPCLYRAPAALLDWQQMNQPQCCNPSKLDHYISLLRTLNTHQLWGHAYVHYLAPLYGGQIIRKVIQHRFPVNLYMFDDAASAIAEVRSQVSVDMADDANSAFACTTDYYQQLYQQHQS